VKVLSFILPPMVAVIFAAAIRLPGIVPLAIFLHIFFLLAPVFERKRLHVSFFIIIAAMIAGLFFNAPLREFFLPVIGTNTIFAEIANLFFQYYLLKDIPLLISALLLLAGLLQFAVLKKQYFRKCSNAHFEKRYTQINTAQKNLAHYYAQYSLAALIAVPLWTAAAFFLEFEPISGIAVSAALAAALPFWGMIGLAILLLVFLTKGIIFLQVGGLLILLSVNWFINYLCNINHPLDRIEYVQIFLVIAICTLLSIPHTAIFAIPVCIATHILIKSLHTPPN